MGQLPMKPKCRAMEQGRGWARSLALLLVFALFLGGSAGWAQDENLSREERLRRHEERVREILKQRQAQTPDPNAVVPTQDAAPPPEEEAAIKLLGSVLLYVRFRPVYADELPSSDIVVRQGDRFVSEIQMDNESATSFDRIQLALRFDKRFIRPIRVYDDGIRPYTEGTPRFEINDRDNVILYDAEMKAPRVSKQVTILKIVWEAIQPTEYTDLQFVFSPNRPDDRPHTAVFMQGENILGRPDDPIDGVLGGALLIMKPFDPESNTGAEILQGKKEELREIYLGSMGAQQRVGLRLVGPEGTPAVGQEFDVDVQLFNPRGAIIDVMRFFVLFDPEVLEVVDNDRNNWIRNGVNVLDGPWREEFPFDFHTQNEADNMRGRVAYGKGLSRGRALRTGTFARIRFRALAPIDQTEIALIAARQGAGNLTAVNYFGYSLLSDDPRYTQPSVKIRINADPLVAAAAGTNADLLRDAPTGVDESFGFETGLPTQ
jgi:hypothetical protein